MKIKEINISARFVLGCILIFIVSCFFGFKFNMIIDSIIISLGIITLFILLDLFLIILNNMEDLN